MNYKMIWGILGKVMLVAAFLMCIPFVVGLIYGEKLYEAFLIPAGALLIVGLILSLQKQRDKSIYAKEGLVLVSMSWIILTLIGAVPFVISGEIPNYVDALFETASGFTTTGATILSNVESLSHGMQFWRIFTHFVGGMGVLVFVLAIIPSGTGAMHIYRAESPGLSANKLVSKMSFTARILYGIYLVMTIIETGLLVAGGMDFYEAILTAFSTAGTGGFSMYNASIAHFNSTYIEMVVAVFMFLFGVNFNVFYLLLLGQFKKIFKCEELRIYSLILFTATVIIAINLLSTSLDFWTALRYSFFQVTSISSTTGFASADFGKWPAFSRSILSFLMIMGACGGSTGGGLKVARLIVLFKSGTNDIKKLLHPRAITPVMFEGEPLEKPIERSVRTFAIIWAGLVILFTVILCLDYGDIFTNLSASMSCIGNVGPVMSELGPNFNFGVYSPVSKILLTVLMLAGRLEIFPVLILFSPYTWRK